MGDVKHGISGEPGVPFSVTRVHGDGAREIRAKRKIP